MGKNQQHVARQIASHSRQDQVEEEAGDLNTIDTSFHSAEWHAARLAALQVERPSWEEWQKKKRVKEAREQEEEDMQERLMKEYKAGLEKDRAERLGHRPGSSRNRDSHDRKKRRKDRKHREKREIEREDKGKSHRRSKRKDREY